MTDLLDRAALLIGGGKLPEPTQGVVEQAGVTYRRPGCPPGGTPAWHLQTEPRTIEHRKNGPIVGGRNVCFWEKIIPVLLLNERRGCDYSRDIRPRCFSEKTNLL